MRRAIELVVDLPTWGEVVVHALVTLPRGAPACLDHDSPDFADAGDPGECELTRVTCGLGVDVLRHLGPRDLEECQLRANDEAARSG